MNAYSELKGAWHLDRIASLRATGRCIPAQIQLIISDKCNHDCSFCAYRMSGYPSNQLFNENGSHNPSRFISLEKSCEILTDAADAGVEAVQYTGGGEPTVHPHHLTIFEHGLSTGMKAAMVTNGNTLRPGWKDVLPAFSWLRISLDAGSPETYAAIRRVSERAWMKVLRNIDRMAAACHETTIGVSFVVTRENAGEIVAAAKVARETGADSIRYTAVFTPEWESYYEPGLTRQIRDDISDAKSLETDHFGVFDQFSSRFLDLREAGGYSVCSYQQFNVYIGGDLTVYRCCNTAYNTVGVLGSLTEMRFSEFLKSKAISDAYRNFNPRVCEHCAFNKQNRALEYMRQENPDHVEFV